MKEEKMRVYADPWLADVAHEQLIRFDPTGKSWELKVYSSEVIAAHLRFGMQVDFVFIADPWFEDWMGEQDPEFKSLKIGSDRVCRFRNNRPKTVPWNNECLVIPATGWPLRTLSDSLLPSSPTDTCRIYAEFFYQLNAFLSRGWVDEGIAFGRLTEFIPSLEVIEESPVIQGLYRCAATGKGRNLQAGQRFYKWMQDEKLRGQLVESGLRD